MGKRRRTEYLTLNIAQNVFTDLDNDKIGASPNLR